MDEERANGGEGGVHEVIGEKVDEPWGWDARGPRGGVLGAPHDNRAVSPILLMCGRRRVVPG
jgi:hypothetical protein